MLFYEAVVSVDESGQIVLPKELRDKVWVRAGDKFVIASLQKTHLMLYCIHKCGALNAHCAEQIAR
jgi:AbrB family looped-hinge helix DNA binding protein